MMIFMNITFLVIVVSIGLLLYGDVPHYTLLTNSSELAGPFNNNEYWAESIE